MSTSAQELGRRARAASRLLALTSTEAKDDALRGAADLLVERSAEILEANALDLESAAADGCCGCIITRSCQLTCVGMDRL